MLEALQAAHMQRARQRVQMTLDAPIMPVDFERSK